MSPCVCRFFRPILSILVLLFVVACGSEADRSPASPGFLEDGAEVYQLHGVKYVPSSSAQLNHGGSSISGSGDLIFLDSLPRVDSSRSFLLRFRLQRDLGRLTLVANANESLESGVEIDFTRRGRNLYITFSALGVSRVFSAQEVVGLGSINAEEELIFVIDIHNNESPVHLMLWNGREHSRFTPWNRLMDSGPLMFEVWRSQRGQGSFWGLKLDGVTVYQAEEGPPKVRH